MSNACNKRDNGIDVHVIHLSGTDAIMAVTVTGVTATVAITVPGGGYWDYNLWLSDSPTNASETLHKPTNSAIVHWQGVTNASGQLSISFQNTGASRTWYMRGHMIRHNVSDAITVGV
jgi:hypothetical protein